MKKLFRPYLTAFLLGALLISTASCDDDDPKPVEDSENITSMTISLEPVSTTKGIDPAEATYTTGTTPTLQLAPNATYDATITFNDNIEAEINTEAEDHELFYKASEDLMIVQKTDFDDNGLPIGLKARITTGNSGETGELTVTLKHQEGLKPDVSDETIGSTDFVGKFNVSIQ
ncbi:hypothetical protein [Pontibacter mangrovi]|uniref:Type 1 periplasmic binding fold superfamily protein n=1 Tax=Pontibacter mangrovi TaxID=2589816 RepID=A0A501WEP8_9BACT|nr:hypothetical protein [Pontibacter mangrovi]TPE45417.1 hypothetical protein FJM65_05135 [Pontibacter mangrovi]